VSRIGEFSGLRWGKALSTVGRGSSDVFEGHPGILTPLAPLCLSQIQAIDYYYFLIVYGDLKTFDMQTIYAMTGTFPERLITACTALISP
jgi:hypothetical protein